MFKKAFTIMELVISLAVIAIIAMVIIPIAKNKMDKVDNFSYYLGYAAVQDIAANIVAQSEYEYEASDLASASDLFGERLAMHFPALKHIYAAGNDEFSHSPGSSGTVRCLYDSDCTSRGYSYCTGALPGSGEKGVCVGMQPNHEGGNVIDPKDGDIVGCQAIANCLSYSASCACTQCADGYKKNMGKCDPACTTTCSGNYTLNSSSCTCECNTSALNSFAQHAGNAHINESACQVECNDGYTMSNGSCVKSCTNTCSGNYQLNSSTCACECNIGSLNSFAQHAGNAHVNESACQVECNDGYTMSNGSCVLNGSEPAECSANQYNDGSGVCRNCSDVTSWNEYKNVMPPCPQACARFGMIYSASKNTCVMPSSATNFCERIKTEYNISKSSCNTTAAQMRANTNAGFKNVDPHIKLSNGLNIYIASDLVKIDALSDAVDVRDRVGYLLYVDVNGNKGKGILYQDVFPFYILMTGKVLPVYNSAGVGGANNVENLSVNILYDDYSSGNRVVKASQTNVDYQTGACATRFIQSANYCKSIPVDAHCANSSADCRFIVNKPMRFFGR